MQYTLVIKTDDLNLARQIEKEWESDHRVQSTAIHKKQNYPPVPVPKCANTLAKRELDRMIHLSGIRF